MQADWCSGSCANSSSISSLEKRLPSVVVIAGNALRGNPLGTIHMLIAFSFSSLYFVDRSIAASRCSFSANYSIFWPYVRRPVSSFLNSCKSPIGMFMADWRDKHHLLKSCPTAPFVRPKLLIHFFYTYPSNALDCHQWSGESRW